MIQVVVRMNMAPRQTAETVRAFRSLKREVQPARGLISAHIYLDAEGTDVLCYVEEWVASEYLGQTEVTEHFTRLFGLMEKSIAAPVLSLNTFGNVLGLKELSALTQAGRIRRAACGEVWNE